MRRLFFAFLLPAASLLSAGSRGRIILTSEGETIGEAAVFGVYEDKECIRPLMKDGRETSVSLQEAEELEGNLYLKETAAPEGYYLCGDTFSVQEAKAEISLGHQRILLCISADQPYPEKYIFDEKGEPAEEENLTAGKTYYVSAASAEEWCCYPAAEVSIPLYDEGIIDIELSEEKYGILRMSHGGGIYEICSDPQCRSQVKDVYGRPASVSSDKPASLPAGTYYLRQNDEEKLFFPDREIYEVSVKEEAETEFHPEQEALHLTVRAAEPDGSPVRADMTCVAAGSDGKETSFPVTGGEAEVLLYHPGIYSFRMTDLPAGYCGSEVTEYSAETAENADISVVLHPFDLRIRLYDEELGRTAEGGTLELTGEDSSVKASWKPSGDEAGDIPLKGNEKAKFRPGDHLKLVCAANPDHYMIAPETDIEIPADISGDLTVTVPAKRYITASLCMKDEQGNITEGGQAVFYTDAECTVPAQTVRGEEAAGESGERIDLFPGTYYIRQTVNPPGCLMNDEITEVRLNDSGLCTLQCRKVKISLILKDAYSGDILEDGILSVIDEEGNVCGEMTSSGGVFTSGFLLAPDTEYTVFPAEAPAYHLFPDDLSIRTGTEENTETEAECAPFISLRIIPKDPDGEVLQGGMYSLYNDEAGTSPAADISGAPVKGRTDFHADLLPGTYYAFEDEAPEGCYPQEAPAEITADPYRPGEMTAEIISEPAFVTILCRGEEDEELPDETVIRISSETAEFEAEVPAEGLRLSCGRNGLAADEAYTLTVVKPAYMHIAREQEIGFMIPSVRPEEPLTVTVRESPYAAVLVQKRGGSAPLSGVRYDVFADQEGNHPAADISGKPAAGKTDENGEILWYLTAGDYWLKESGGHSHWYSQTDPVKITVSPRTEPSLRIISESAEASFCVSVCDTEGNPLSGAGIEVFDRQDKCIAEFVSEGEPHLLNDVQLTPEGVYTIHQTSAADGYAVNGTDIEFVMPETAPAQTPVLMIRNERLKKSAAGRRAPAGKSFPFWLFIPPAAAFTAGLLALYRRLK